MANFGYHHRWAEGRELLGFLDVFLGDLHRGGNSGLLLPIVRACYKFVFSMSSIAEYPRSGQRLGFLPTCTGQITSGTVQPDFCFCNPEGLCFRQQYLVSLPQAAGQAPPTIVMTLSQVDGNATTVVSIVEPEEIVETVDAIQLRWMPTDKPAYSLGLMTGSFAGRLSVTTVSSTASSTESGSTRPTDMAQDNLSSRTLSYEARVGLGVGLGLGGVLVILVAAFFFLRYRKARLGRRLPVYASDRPTAAELEEDRGKAELEAPHGERVELPDNEFQASAHGNAEATKNPSDDVKASTRGNAEADKENEAKA
jgi:hypothetical protein